MRSGAIHVSPEAFGSNWWGSPPNTGTSQVSHLKRAVSCVYATLDPSGENVTPFLRTAVWVSWTGSRWATA